MKNESRNVTVRRLTFSAIMLALATCLALVCSLIPFLNLPFGGGFTIASMLPIVIVSYMYGVKHGLFTAFVYSVIQMVLDLMLGSSSTIIALFLPDSGMALISAILICLIDYVAAYTLLGLGGVFRHKFKSKTTALALGTLLALALRYLMHILSGFIFYGSYAEWFFTQEGFYKIGGFILDHTSGTLLALIYSIFYNGLYMIPEIIITVIAAVIISRLPQIKPVDEVKA